MSTRASRASSRTGADRNPDAPPPGDPDDQGDPQGDPEDQGNNPVPQAAQPIPFALVPAQANQAILDYSRPEDVKMFINATRSLYSDSSELFNCDLDGLWDFLQLVEQRSNVMGIHAIYQVPHQEAPTAQTVTLPFLANYGVFTLLEVQQHAGTYISTRTRMAQDSIILYHMLWNSLSATGRAKVGIKSEDYVLGGITAGIPFLKVIIDDSGIETHATVSNIRTQLSKLDEYMTSVDSDIKKFNIHVKTLIIGLCNHRQSSTDLLIHLFKGYKAASDAEFVAFIKRKEESYEEGMEMDPEHLMALAEGKYKIRLNRGNWKAAAETDKRILALEAKIKGFERKTPKKVNKQDNKVKGGPTQNKKKQIPQWAKQPPKPEEEAKSKFVDSKEYWWCTVLKRWCHHKPVDCRAGKPSRKETGKKPQNQEHQKKLRLAKALEAIKCDESDNCDSDHSE